jgi:cellulase
MRTTSLLSLATLVASVVNGHAIFQRIRVNDVDQGQLVGVRAPAQNTPVQDVTGDSIACNTGLKSPVSSAVVTIPAGAKVGAWYEHVLGGPQVPNDPDNPIAHSHKGPLMVYMAKVCYFLPLNLGSALSCTFWLRLLNKM